MMMIHFQSINKSSSSNKDKNKSLMMEEIKNYDCNKIICDDINNKNIRKKYFV